MASLPGGAGNGGAGTPPTSTTKRGFFFGALKGRPSLPGSIKKKKPPSGSEGSPLAANETAAVNVATEAHQKLPSSAQHQRAGESMSSMASSATSVFDMGAGLDRLTLAAHKNEANAITPKPSSATSSPTKRTKAIKSPPIINWNYKILRTGIEDCGPAPRVRNGGLTTTVHGKKYEQLLVAANVDSNALQQLAWNGVPDVARAVVWQLLLGYLPSNQSRREVTLRRKRGEYLAAVRQYWDIDNDRRTDNEQKLLHQISVDIPRTHPDVPLFHTAEVQRGLERVLYIWSLKHPASGYVQGMNDLATPFFLVFLGAFVDNPRACDISRVPQGVLSAVEADTYWCLTKLLDGIQDHYPPSQPGIQRMIHRMEELVKRIDHDLYSHLEREHLMFMQFAFRWMNCLLMRELSLSSTVRLWDTYLAETGNGFDDFHVYVCTSFLVSWSGSLKQKSFQDLITFLQALPTQNWIDRDIEMLVSQAFVLQTQFQQGQAHLR